MKQYLHIVCAAVLLLVILGDNVAAQSQADNSAADSRRNGIISGRVVDQNGQPLPNVTVYIHSSNRTSTSHAVTTDNQGRFQGAGLEPALYNVSARAPTYVNAVPDMNNQPSVYRLGDSITLTLVKGGVITGTVTSVSGEPLVQIGVRAILIQDVDGRKYGWTLGERYTDDRGVYRLYGLAPGTYRVAVGGGQGWSYSSGWENAYDRETPTYAPSSTLDTATEVVVRSGEETSGVDIRHRADRGHVVSGIVIKPGEPNDTYPGAGVILTPASNTVGTSIMSVLRSMQSPGSKGFSIENVPDGDYALTGGYETGPNDRAMSDPQRITVKGADVTGLKLIAKPVGSISGRLVLSNSTAPECKDKQRPVFAETQVSANNNSTKFQDDWMRRQMLSLNRVAPDQTGAFSFGFVTAGQYSFDVEFSAKHWYLQAVTPAVPAAGETATQGSSLTKKLVGSPSNLVSIKSGERMTGLTITLAEGAASLRGRITTVEGEQLPGRLLVHLVPAEKDNADDVLRFYTGRVSEDGGFALNQVAPGQYWAIASEGNSRRTDLRRPDQVEARRKLLREAETVKIAWS